MPIHPTAVIDPKARVASSADIGPYAIVEGPVEIGEHVRLYPHVYVTGWTQIGDRCEVHPGAVVGHVPQDFHFKGERSYCRIGAGTIIREFASIHRGTQPESATILGENCFILGYAHIGHNCELAAGVKVYNNTLIAGHAIIGENAIISGNVAVHQFARIGEYVMVGGNARIAKDIPPYMKALHESQCVGYNAIGLRRSGKFSREEINEVREAYSTIFRSSLPFRKAVETFAPNARTRAGRNIVEFINSPSRLGVCGGRDRSAIAAGVEDEEATEGLANS